MSARLLPMLAVASAPFDSPEYLFEVKWNGIRALAQSARRSWALWGREGVDYQLRYPELAILRRLPAGTVVDGELVRPGPNGVSDLGAVLHRHQLCQPQRIRQASRLCPVVYVVFDLLCVRGRWLLGEALPTRRKVLQEVLEVLAEPSLLFSEGVVGRGKAFFEALVAQGQEGMMAKHLASGYRPGRRCAAWRKIKPVRRGRNTSGSIWSRS